MSLDGRDFLGRRELKQSLLLERVVVDESFHATNEGTKVCVTQN